MMTLAPARVCEVCGSWPCGCLRERVATPYIEPTVRVEPCVCGGTIVVYGAADVGIMHAAREHNATTEHVLWRRR